MNENKVDIPHNIAHQMVFLKLLSDHLENGAVIDEANVISLRTAVSDLNYFLDSIDKKSKNPIDTSSGSKVFDEIKEEYEFFLKHSTEAEASLRQLVQVLESHVLEKKGVYSLLDFGCGDGGFTQELLESGVFDGSKIDLSLVEVNSSYLVTAKSNLESFSRSAIVANRALEFLPESSVDICVANHSVYYVKDLAEFLQDLKRVMKKGSLLLCTLANFKNEIYHLNKTFYEMHGLKLPKFIADDFAEVLKLSGMSYQSFDYESEFVFQDTLENKLKSIKFFNAVDFPDTMDVPAMLRLFQSYKVESKIRISLNDTLFLVRF